MDENAKLMHKLLVGLLLFTLPVWADLDEREAQAAGRRVWANECGGRVDGLTSWNAGEEFPSLGIGHFIWYPRGYQGPFEESFPKLVAYLKGHGVQLPAWLEANPACPWTDRQAFLADFHKPRLTQLRQLLADHVGLQTRFMAQRMQDALPKILQAAPESQRSLLDRRFHAVLESPGGVYALLDYVNFKGEGVKPTERYHGQGWGLLQVLEEMEERRPPLDAFARSAESVLRRRIRNSPPERGEGRWLEGWLNRVHSYRT